jgi:3-oxoacyl-[acyl-carrier protein] reductase
MGRVQDKAAVVTGAAHGLGRAIALRLAEEGARMALGDVDGAALERTVSDITKAGGQAFGVVGDVTEEAPAARLIDDAAARYGRLDILVNNAAVRDVTPLDDIDLATWRRITGIILDGAFIMTKAALAPLRESGAGAIVNIGGMSGHTGAAGRPHVVAAKLGLVGLTRALAHDLAHDKITVNCVVPGLIDTKRTESSGSKTAHLRETIIGRHGTPEEVAAAVRFLAGPNARYITGQDWHVNGGAYLG